MQQEKPALTCGRIVVTSHHSEIAAALIYVNTQVTIKDRRNCVAASFAEALGLQGTAQFGTSIKTNETSTELTDLDREHCDALRGEEWPRQGACRCNRNAFSD